MFKHELGKAVQQKTTGLKGIITARSENLYGCNRYYVQPKALKDSKLPDGWWMDEDDIKVTGRGVIVEKKNTGGPMSKVV
jgi:hypothetical protein